MKILYLRTFFNFGLKAGGSVGHTAGVINGLRKNHQVDVITNDHLPEVKGGFTIIKPFRLNIGLISSILEQIYNIKLLFKLKDVRSYDVIYHRYTGSSFLAAYLSKKHNIPLILEFNSSTVWALKNWEIKQSAVKDIVRVLFNKIYRIPVTSFIESYNLKHADVVNVVSEVSKENLVKEGINPDKILVNPNGVDIDKYDLNPDSADLKNSLGLQEGDFVPGFIGTFVNWHGIEELAQAVVLFFDRYPEKLNSTKFLLIGDGNLMVSVREIINSSAYKNNVIFTGMVPQNEGPMYLSLCDIFLSPHVPNPDGTKFFGSPTKLFEYMSMSKPIIASSLDQIGDILEHGKTAYLVEPGNVEELCESIKTVMDSPDLMKELSLHSRNEVIARYTWDKHVDRIIDKLNQTLQSG